MNVRVLVLWLFLALTARAVEREVTRTFPVEPGSTVKVDLYRGKISIEEDDVSEVRVGVRLEVAVETEAEANRALGSLQLDLKSEGNAVSVVARNPAETRVRFVWNDKYRVDLSCKITVPRQCNVDLRTREGTISVGSLTGHVVARTETGNISIRRIDGSVDASTQFGSLIVSRCSGATTLETLKGTIRAGTIGGPASLKNMTGSIEVLAARAGVTAFAEAGDIIIGFPRDFTGDSDIRTSGGDIEASIDPAASGVIKASTVWSRIQSKLALAIESGGDGKRSLIGRLNDGGPVLTLHASGGHVKILPGETYFE